MDNVILLDWDTKFFGFPVAQISSNRLDKKSLKEVLNFCQKNKIKLLQFKCDAHHRQSVLLAEKNNFHFADVRITLTKQLSTEDCHEENLPNKISFRVGDNADIPTLKDIVTDIYTNSRYYFDTNFPRNDVHGFYRNWIEKSVLGNFDDLVWVLCNDDVPIACCSILYNSSRLSATIGLFAVDDKMSGQGLGNLLLSKVLRKLSLEGVKKVSVVTQGRNYGAQRLYQRAGFQSETMEIYYHCWFDINGEKE